MTFWCSSQLYVADAHGLSLRALVLGVAVKTGYPGKDHKETEQKQSHHDKEYGQQKERIEQPITAACDKSAL
jgi:hypothetical protein